MGATNYLITADYPGAAAAFVEGAYGDQTLALFLQGCTGDVRPNFTAPDGSFRSATWTELARAGRELGGAVGTDAAERRQARVKTTSTSTGASSGSTGTPTADRA